MALPQSPPTTNPRRWVAALIAAVAVIMVSSCGGSGSNESSNPQIVVTSSILGDIVSQLSGDAVELTVLMDPGVSPHDFQISAKQAALMRSSDLLIAVGGGFEDGLADAISSAKSDGANVLEVFPALSLETDNPHFFADPDLVVQAVDIIGQEVLSLDGIDDTEVENNTADFLTALQTLTANITEEVSSIPENSKQLVTDHNEFDYFAKRFGFETPPSIIEGSSSAHSANAGHISELAEVIRDNDIPAIFTEESASQDLANTLAKEVSGVEVVGLYSESLGPSGSGAETYISMMRTNVERITEALT